MTKSRVQPLSFGVTPHDWRSLTGNPSSQLPNWFAPVDASGVAWLSRVPLGTILKAMQTTYGRVRSSDSQAALPSLNHPLAPQHLTSFASWPNWRSVRLLTSPSSNNQTLRLAWYRSLRDGRPETQPFRFDILTISPLRPRPSSPQNFWQLTFEALRSYPYSVSAPITLCARRFNQEWGTDRASAESRDWVINADRSPVVANPPLIETVVDVLSKLFPQLSTTPPAQLLAIDDFEENHGDKKNPDDRQLARSAGSVSAKNMMLFKVKDAGKTYRVALPQRIAQALIDRFPADRVTVKKSGAVKITKAHMFELYRLLKSNYFGNYLNLTTAESEVVWEDVKKRYFALIERDPDGTPDTNRHLLEVPINSESDSGFPTDASVESLMGRFDRLKKESLPPTSPDPQYDGSSMMSDMPHSSNSVSPDQIQRCLSQLDEKYRELFLKDEELTRYLKVDSRFFHSNAWSKLIVEYHKLDCELDKLAVTELSSYTKIQHIHIKSNLITKFQTQLTQVSKNNINHLAALYTNPLFQACLTLSLDSDTTEPLKGKLNALKAQFESVLETYVAKLKDAASQVANQSPGDREIIKSNLAPIILASINEHRSDGIDRQAFVINAWVKIARDFRGNITHITDGFSDQAFAIAHCVWHTVRGKCSKAYAGISDQNKWYLDEIFSVGSNNNSTSLLSSGEVNDGLFSDDPSEACFSQLYSDKKFCPIDLLLNRQLAKYLLEIKLALSPSINEDQINALNGFCEKKLNDADFQKALSSAGLSQIPNEIISQLDAENRQIFYRRQIQDSTLRAVLSRYAIHKEKGSTSKAIESLNELYATLQTNLDKKESLIAAINTQITTLGVKLSADDQRELRISPPSPAVVSTAKIEPASLVFDSEPLVSASSQDLSALLKGASPLNKFKWAFAAVHAVKQLHDQQRIHLDIKPQNFEVVDDQVQFKPSNTFDFRQKTCLKLKEEDALIGTEEYIDPSAVVFGQYSQASDIYSLAVMLCRDFGFYHGGKLKRYITSSELQRVLPKLYFVNALLWKKKEYPDGRQDTYIDIPKLDCTKWDQLLASGLYSSASSRPSIDRMLQAIQELAASQLNANDNSEFTDYCERLAASVAPMKASVTVTMQSTPTHKVFAPPDVDSVNDAEAGSSIEHAKARPNPVSENHSPECRMQHRPKQVMSAVKPTRPTETLPTVTSLFDQAIQAFYRDKTLMTELHPNNIIRIWGKKSGTITLDTKVVDSQSIRTIVYAEFEQAQTPGCNPNLVFALIAEIQFAQSLASAQRFDLCFDPTSLQELRQNPSAYAEQLRRLQALQVTIQDYQYPSVSRFNWFGKSGVGQGLAHRIFGRKKSPTPYSLADPKPVPRGSPG